MKKLLVVSHRPIMGIVLFKEKIQKTFLNFDVTHIFIQEDENINISENINAVIYTEDVDYDIIEKTKKYFEVLNIPMIRIYPYPGKYMEIENIMVFMKNEDAFMFLKNKLVKT